METRQTLLQKIKNLHDEKSWEEFVNYYRGYVFVLVKGMSISHHESEDLTQQVMLKLWRGIESFEYKPDQCKFRSWLTLVTKNTVRDYVKSKAYKQQKDILDIADWERSVLPEIDLISQKEWKVHVSTMAWTNIKPGFKESVLSSFLKMQKGETPQSIAKDLDIAENSVYVFRKRVEKALAKEIVRLDRELS